MLQKREHIERKINNRKKSDWFVYHCDYSTNKCRDFDNRVKKCGKGICKTINLRKT